MWALLNFFREVGAFIDPQATGGGEAGGVGGPDARPACFTGLPRLRTRLGIGRPSRACPPPGCRSCRCTRPPHRAAHRLRGNSHIAQARLPHLGLLRGRRLLLGLAQAPRRRAPLPAQARLGPRAGAGQLHRLLVGRGHAAVRALAEGPPPPLFRFRRLVGSSERRRRLLMLHMLTDRTPCKRYHSWHNWVFTF